MPVFGTAPADPRERFVEEVAQRLRRRWDVTSVDRAAGGLSLQVHLRGQREPAVVGLANVWTRVQAQPDRRTPVIDALLRTARASGGPAAVGSWPAAASRLLPAIRPAGYERLAPSSDMESTRTALHREPLARGLLLCLSLPLGDSSRLVSVEDLRSWGVDPTVARDRALENLRNSGLQLAPHPSAPAALTAVGPQGHQSSWLALPADLHAAVPDGGETLVAVVPTREDLGVVSAKDPGGVVALLQWGRDLALHTPRPTSAGPFAVGDGGVTPWQPPPGHPAASVVRDCRTVDRVFEAVAEHNNLVRAHGDEVAVSPLRLLQRPNRTLACFAIWREGVVTLLPDADFVAFAPRSGNGSASFLVPWATVQDVAADCLTVAAADAAPRWRTCAWPTGRVLQRLRRFSEPAPGLVEASPGAGGNGGRPVRSHQPIAKGDWIWR